ncbi:hypothetical protein [Streptomyces sp. NPDC088775]|uniref:hypothetical protein n=1 Tax=Streptomyces sp. NPDC088775 TaxID=3365896 RepID=UPI0038074F3B
MTYSKAAVAAALLAFGRAGSAVGDMWIQNDFCAKAKAATDKAPVTYKNEKTGAETTHGTADGRRACIHHCLTYTATQALAVGVSARVLGIRLHPGAAAAALAISGVTHYIADRRVPGGVLETLARKTRKGSFYKLASHGMNGAFQLDNAYHHGWEAVAALVATTGASER